MNAEEAVVHAECMHVTIIVWVPLCNIRHSQRNLIKSKSFNVSEISLNSNNKIAERGSQIFLYNTGQHSDILQLFTSSLASSNLDIQFGE